MIEYVLFDVAGTLLYKPKLYKNIQDTLSQFGYQLTLEEIKFKHKLLSEIIHFPDRTSKDFYLNFNTTLLELFGILPTKEIVDAVFSNCTYLDWEKFDDTEILKSLNVPLGIASNFNTTLNEKLQNNFGNIFSDIIVSEDVGSAKPSTEFYQAVLKKINIDPKKILYIGDSLKLDIQPTIKLNFNSLLIDRDNFYPASKYKIANLHQIVDFL